MRKFLLALGFMALAGTSQAAFVQCSPSQDEVVQAGVATAPVAFTCGPIGTDGDGIFYTALTLSVGGTYQNSGEVGDFGFTLSVSSNTLDAALDGFYCTDSSTAVGDSQLAIGGCASSAGVALASLDSIPAFTINVQASDPLAVGALLAFNGSATVSYETTEQSAIPEPTSMALLGSGLVGLAFFARRRTRK